jgi:hypothetical protein
MEEDNPHKEELSNVLPFEAKIQLGSSHDSQHAAHLNR